MALPSAVTLGSAALIVAAGVGLVAVSSFADEQPTEESSGTTPSTSTAPATTAPTRTVEPRKPDKTKEPKPDRSNAVPKVFVEVYNNSGITGLAAETAATLEGAGWNVAATDNWYGSIPDNTVYYPDGMRAEAKRLAKLLGYSRLRPAVSPMQFDRLTVIITTS
jgi:hypothetical protein